MGKDNLSCCDQPEKLGNYMKNKRLWAIASNSERARLLPDPLQAKAVPLPPILLRSAGKELREIINQMQLMAVSGKSARDFAEAFRAGPMQDDILTLAIRVNAALEYYHGLGQIGSLAIFASPDMIETLRQTFNSELRELIVLERPTTYCHLSEEALLALVRDSLREAQHGIHYQAVLNN
jgi:hypothetical protein